MKGFASTPIIFIAVFIIVAMLFIQFMNIDKQTAESIGKEARLRKLQIGVLKNQTSSAGELYFCSVFAARVAADKSQLESKIKDCSHKTVSTQRKNKAFVVNYKLNYNSNLIDTSIEKEITVSSYVDYPFFEIIDAVNNFPNEISQVSCKDLYDGKYDTVIAEGGVVKGCKSWFTLSSNFEWCGRIQSIYDCTASTCKIKYYVARVRLPGTLSEDYFHYVDKIFDSTCKVPQ